MPPESIKPRGVSSKNVQLTDSQRQIVLSLVGEIRVRQAFIDGVQAAIAAFLEIPPDGSVTLSPDGRSLVKKGVADGNVG